METHPAATKTLVLGVILSLFMAGLASAQLPPPDVTFIPDQISAGSSFAMVADPGSVTGAVRITWVTGQGYGLLPLVDGKHMCYFSDTDPTSLCGPSPFRVASTPGYPYVMDVNTFDGFGGQGNTTLEVDVGGLKLDPRITMSGSNALMVVYVIGGLADSVEYRVYDSSFTPVTEYELLSLIPENLAFNGSTPLGTGKYYIAFRAESASDFGGGIKMVENGGTTTNGETTSGIVEAEALDIEMFIDQGTIPSIPVNKKITSTVDQNYTGITIELPTTSPLNIKNYLRITPSSTDLDPFGTIYYNASFIRSIDSGMDINTEAEIKSGGVTLGTIPIRVKLSVRGGTTTTECSTATDGTACTGGICCSGVCRSGGECCDDADCTTAGEECDSYQCVTAPVSCSVGTCRTSCYTGEEATLESCTISGLSGVCCVEVNECDGEPDGAYCTSCTESTCVCCDGFCVECCSDDDCLTGYECLSNYCFEMSEPPAPEGLDMFTIILIVVMVAAAGFAAYYFLKVRKKPSSGDEELEGEKIDEDETFDDEEFY